MHERIETPVLIGDLPKDGHFTYNGLVWGRIYVVSYGQSDIMGEWWTEWKWLRASCHWWGGSRKQNPAAVHDWYVHAGDATHRVTNQEITHYIDLPPPVVASA